MYCGIDVAKGKSQVCILDKQKNVLAEFEIQHDQEGFKTLDEHLNSESKVLLESTSTYCKAIFDYLRDRYETHYVDVVQMRNFAKLHFPHIKNDRVDAKMLATYLTFDFKTIDPKRHDELKDLCRIYAKTLKQLTRYKYMFASQLTITIAVKTAVAYDYSI